jgi:hypothetical protein
MMEPTYSFLACVQQIHTAKYSIEQGRLAGVGAACSQNLIINHQKGSFWPTCDNNLWVYERCHSMIVRRARSQLAYLW